LPLNLAVIDSVPRGFVNWKIGGLMLSDSPAAEGQRLAIRDLLGEWSGYQIISHGAYRLACFFLYSRQQYFDVLKIEN